MFVESRNFHLTSDFKWDGKKMQGKYYKIPCIRNIGRYKLFSDKTWDGNGFGNSSSYYILDTEKNDVFTYNTARRVKVIDIVSYLKENTI